MVPENGEGGRVSMTLTSIDVGFILVMIGCVLYAATGSKTILLCLCINVGCILALWLAGCGTVTAGCNLSAGLQNEIRCGVGVEVPPTPMPKLELFGKEGTKQWFEEQ